LKNTRNTTPIHEVTTFRGVADPNVSTIIGASAILAMEFTAVMKGWKIALRTIVSGH
jgi:hypothetical protein